jgi:hypothetical protein
VELVSKFKILLLELLSLLAEDSLEAKIQLLLSFISEDILWALLAAVRVLEVID